MSNEDNPDFNRRDFLKLGGAAAAGAALAKAPRLVVEIARRLDDFENPNFSNREPRFNFADHNLKPVDITPDIAVVSGENGETELENYLALKRGEEPRYSSVLSDSPSTGVSEQDRIDQRRAILKMLDQDTVIIASDLSFSLSSPAGNLSTQALEMADSMFETKKRILTTGGNILAGAAAVGVTLAGVRLLRDAALVGKLAEFYEKNPKTAKKINQAVYFAAGLSVTPATDKETLRNIGTSIRHEFDQFLVSTKDRDLARMFNNLAVRDNSMAANTRLGLKILDNLPETSAGLKAKHPEAEVYFYAGGGHVKAKDAYFLGQLYLDSQTESQVHDTFVECSKDLEKSQALGEKETAESLEYWVNLTESFNYPLASFMNSEEFVQADLDRIPQSPRAHLWDYLLDRKSRDPENQLLDKLIERLAKEDITHRELFTDIYIPEVSIRAKMDDKCQQIKTFSTSQGSYELRFTAGIPMIFKIS